MIKKVEKYLRKGSFLAQFQTLSYFKPETLSDQKYRKAISQNTS